MVPCPEADPVWPLMLPAPAPVPAPACAIRISWRCTREVGPLGEEGAALGCVEGEPLVHWSATLVAAVTLNCLDDPEAEFIPVLDPAPVVLLEPAVASLLLFPVAAVAPLPVPEALALSLACPVT